MRGLRDQWITLGIDPDFDKSKSAQVIEMQHAWDNAWNNEIAYFIVILIVIVNFDKNSSVQLHFTKSYRSNNRRRHPSGK
jgi:hypothetical protein